MGDMEAMIFHFKQVMEGVKPPVGEVYMGMENPKGELGYYIVSDGTAKPVRWRIRPPSFINLSSLPTMCEGALLSDVIAINASIDIVMGGRWWCTPHRQRGAWIGPRRPWHRDGSL
jgi:NADH-quinone oxidoreductase subunit D